MYYSFSSLHLCVLSLKRKHIYYPSEILWYMSHMYDHGHENGVRIAWEGTR